MDEIAHEKAQRKSFAEMKERWQRRLVADLELSAGDLRIAMAIGWHMNHSKGGVAWPSISTLCKLTGLCKTTCLRSTKHLEQRGHLQIVRVSRRPNQYRPVMAGSVAMIPAGSVAATPALVAQLGHRPGSVATLPEPLSEPPINIEPLREPLRGTLEETNIQIQRLGDEERIQGSKIGPGQPDFIGQPNLTAPIKPKSVPRGATAESTAAQIGYAEASRRVLGGTRIFSKWDRYRN
jgi:hypothetical protein